MKYKRLLALLLAVILALPALFAPATARAAGEMSPEDMQKAMEQIADAAGRITELTGGAAVSSVFSDFLNIVTTGGSVVTAINGSVTFLRLIGVIEDPVSGGIANIIGQLQHVDEKLDAMDSQLKSIADKMTQMQAEQDLYHRGETALMMSAAWKKFESDYMEKLDSMMVRYDSMMSDGIKAWCLDASEANRQAGGIDNTQIILVYTDDGKGGETPLFFLDDKVPDDYADGHWIILTKDCLPGQVSFNVNTYRETLKKAIADRIEAQLAAENYDAFPSKNEPMLTAAGKGTATREAIEAIAADAVNVLCYRAGAVEVNESADFAAQATLAFNNYCSHLLSANDGVDAMLKDFYLTHAFEYQVSDDLQAFMDRMLLKTGTYGTFILTLQGMSDSTKDETKLQTLQTLCAASDDLAKTKKRCITGQGNYCYLTGSEVVYTSAFLQSTVSIDSKQVYNDTVTYKSYQASPITLELHVPFDLYEQSIMDSRHAVLLIDTLRENGVTGDLHSYFLKQVNPPLVADVADYGMLLTDYEPESMLPLSEKIPLRVQNVLGNDFAGMSAFVLSSSTYPDDAAPKYIVYRQQVKGELVELKTGAVMTDAILHAAAVYGQNHSYWFKDEAAIFGGPASGRLDWNAETVQTGKFEYTDRVILTNVYNVLLVYPQAMGIVGTGYYPLEAFRALNEELMAKERPEPEKPDVPATGEHFLPTAIAITLTLSMLGIACVVRKKHKENA